MKMNESDLLKKYEEDKSTLLAFGTYVKASILAELTKEFNTNTELDKILQIVTEPRLKTASSLVEKAFYRKKSYSNPYDDITDKIGIRFVCLLLDNIEDISNIIEKNESWSYSLDRDFEEEKKNAPTLFTYQSKHYVVSSKSNFKYQDSKIYEGIKCEIQIRTLLQHAYCELAHDTIYKPKFCASHEIHRLMARSMALIETTDTIFIDAINTINLQEKQMNNFLSKLYNFYESILGKTNVEIKLNNIILDAFNDTIKDETYKELVDFYNNNENKFIITKIKDKFDLLLYSQPAILFVYFFVKKNEYTAKERWPLPANYLRPIYTDIGLSFDN
jgi:putative GTP pyrophosphokinase